MNDKEILANTPEGSTHIEIFTQIPQKPYYYRREFKGWCNKCIYDWWDSDNKQWLNSSTPTGNIRSLADIQRIVELESHLDAEANSCFILEGKNKDLEKSNAACAVAINEMISRGEVKSLLKGNSEIDAIVNKFAIEQQAKGIEDFCSTLWGYQDAYPSSGDHVTSLAGYRDDFISKLRNQAKEAS